MIQDKLLSVFKSAPSLRVSKRDSGIYKLCLSLVGQKDNLLGFWKPFTKGICTELWNPELEEARTAFIQVMKARSGTTTGRFKSDEA